MRIKKVATRFLWVVLFALLAACGAAPKVDNAAATKIVATFMAQITQTAAAADDLPATVEPTETESPEETETPFVTPTPDAGTLLLGRFRTVTVVKGNLFVRDGTGLPVQITKSGKDHDPVISADGKKIVFYRGEGFDEVFAVNADGSGEKAIINNKLLPVLSKGSVRNLVFQFGTHNILFNTSLCKETCEVSIFFLDIELAKVTEFTGKFDLPRGGFPNFNVSPDGNFLLVQNSEQVDLYGMDGKIIYPAIVSGDNTKTHWLSDSSGAIVLTATRGTYTIWHYTLQNNQTKQISIDPQPLFDEDIACYISISPDRNEMLYQDKDHKKHIGKLKDADVQLYKWNSDCHVQWSPDSQHFASQTAIGSVDGTPPISIDGRFIAWLDATHYLFSKGKNIVDLQSYIAEIGKESAAVPTNFIWSPIYAVLEPGP